MAIGDNGDSHWRQAGGISATTFSDAAHCDDLALGPDRR
jgi:hypothetical protein